MKNIVILELGVSNFRGQNFKDSYKENEVKISGRNRSGKSTRFAAWCWLLTGRTDPNNPANTKLFDDRVELSPDTPAASVWAVISIDGQSYRLERTAKAAFVRKKGTDIVEKKSSDDYIYSVDNITFTATDFKEWIAVNIAPDDMMCFVIGGEFFINQIFDDKRRARQIIERVVGEVKPEEMKGDYTLIAEDMQKYSLDEIDNKYANLVKGVNQRLNEIPTLIWNAEHDISEIEQNDFKANDEDIARLEAERDNCNKRLMDLSERMRPQMEAKAKVEHDRKMKQAVYDEAKKAYEQSLIEEDNNLVLEISKTEEENRKKQQEKARLTEMSATDERLRNECVENLNVLQKEKESILAEKFDIVDVCPVCGNPISEENKMKEKAAFTARQKAKLDGIVARGKDIQNGIDAANKRIADRLVTINEIQIIDVAPLRLKLDELRKRDIMPFAETNQGKILQAEIDAIVVPEITMPEDGEIKAELDRINAELVPLYELRGLKSRITHLTQMVADLKAEQREKGVELAQYERKRQLVKDYKQEQMEILSHKVNDGLNFSRIEVWSTQKDGNVIPDLVLKDAQGVSYACTNNASRIVTTIDVQRFFCEKLDVNMPCWVDEATIINADNLPILDGVQMLYMFCSNTSLTIETK